jgi:hypothetical protein
MRQMEQTWEFPSTSRKCWNYIQLPSYKRRIFVKYSSEEKLKRFQLEMVVNILKYLHEYFHNIWILLRCPLWIKSATTCVSSTRLSQQHCFGHNLFIRHWKITNHLWLERRHQELSIEWSQERIQCREGFLLESQR